MSPNCCIRCKTKGPDFKKRSFSWRKITSWGMLDFSNSIVLMVLLGQYSSFIVNYLYESERSTIASDRIMYANIALSILTFVISPPLGVLIDTYYFRVPLVVVSVIGYSVSSMVLYIVKLGVEILPIVMYALGILFFRMNEMVCGAFLPSLCNDRDMGFVSSWGYFIGFVSGVIITLITKLFTTPPAGTEDRRGYTIQGYGTTMMIVGIIQLLSAIPPILMLDNGIPEGEKRPRASAKAIPHSFRETALTIKHSFRLNRTLTLILLCYIIFSIGLQSYISFGSIMILKCVRPYGYTINNLQDTGLFYNCAVGVSSLVYGVISKYISAYWLVIFMLILILVGTSCAFWWDVIPQTENFNPAFFFAWFMMALYSLSVGPVQAVIRGTVGLLTPDDKKAEVFGCLESIIILGTILGSTIPGKLVSLPNPDYYFIWCICFFGITFIMWIFIPVRKEEKKAVERMKEAAAAKSGVDGLMNAALSAGSGSGEVGYDVKCELSVHVSSSSSSSSTSTSSTPLPRTSLSGQVDSSSSSSSESLKLERSE